MTEKNVDDILFRFKKVNIIGSENVGKTTLVQELFKTYAKNLNIEKFQYSVENNKMKLIDGLDKIKVNFENKTLNLFTIRTTITTDNYNLISNNLKSLIFHSELIIFMIDITNEESFNLITKLYSSSEDFKDKKILILSNKLDKDNERKISGFSIKEFVENNDNKIKNDNKNNQITSFEISLINEKENLDEFIENLYNTLYNMNDSNIYDIIKIQDPPKISKNIFDFNNIKDSYNLSLFLLGNSTVGKTSFKQRFFSNSFSDNTILTLGVDFDRTICKIGDKMIKLELCDTAGQERFRAIPRQHYSKADGFILIFDVCEEKSFKDVENWIKDIVDNTKGNINGNNNNNVISGNEIAIFLVGNKIDNIEKRVVTYKEGEDFAKLHGIKYCEISCKSGLNVYEVMTEIIMDSYINIRGDKSKSFKLLLKSNKNKKNKKLCC